ncbi:hypothetical protein [Catelliglobosispora koreensis]|uniref:hypothetical protein n=1 Tax=Catelliglobosispora koreensis TaxID=129052 RepID=UPI00037C9181|nr:hypothetical protein [Catelliglobosispora koreensis]
MSDNNPGAVALLDAARHLAAADLRPVTAWHLDTQLCGLGQGAQAFAKATYRYAENLGTGIDPRVIYHITDAAECFYAASAAFQYAAKNLRTVYAAHFEAAESGVRQPRPSAFFGPKPQSGQATSRTASQSYPSREQLAAMTVKQLKDVATAYGYDGLKGTKNQLAEQLDGHFTLRRNLQSLRSSDQRTQL